MPQVRGRIKCRWRGEAGRRKLAGTPTCTCICTCTCTCTCVYITIRWHMRTYTHVHVHVQVHTVGVPSSGKGRREGGRVKYEGAGQRGERRTKRRETVNSLMTCDPLFACYYIAAVLRPHTRKHENISCLSQ